MKKGFNKRIILMAMILGMQSMTLAEEAGGSVSSETSLNDPQAIFINNQSCPNTSYEKSFVVNKDNGEAVHINISNKNPGTTVWVKLKINGSYVYSTVLATGEDKVYEADAVEGEYELKIVSLDGAKMDTHISAVQY